MFVLLFKIKLTYGQMTHHSYRENLYLHNFTDLIGIDSLISEFNDLTAKFGQIFELPGSYYLLDRIYSPVFACENNFETAELYKSYSATREKIIEAYEGKPIFEVTMNQWRTHL